MDVCSLPRRETHFLQSPRQWSLIKSDLIRCPMKRRFNFYSKILKMLSLNQNLSFYKKKIVLILIGQPPTRVLRGFDDCSKSESVFHCYALERRNGFSFLLIATILEEWVLSPILCKNLQVFKSYGLWVILPRYL